MLRGNSEGEMALLSEDSSVKESPEDKQTSVPCAKGRAKISRRVTLARFTGLNSYDKGYLQRSVMVIDLNQKWRQFKQQIGRCTMG